MFLAEFSSGRGWQSPRVVPYQSLNLDPSAAVLHYGQAIFEGLKAFRGVDGKIRLFRPKMNWQRMKASADRLCMPFIDLEFFLAALTELVRVDHEWIPAHPGTSFYLRPTLIGTEGFLGLRPAEEYLFYVIASPVGAYYAGGAETIRIWVEREYSRAARGGIGAAKAGGNYASSLLVAAEAKKRGFAQVLWLDACQKKFVEEVGTMNVFFAIGNKVVTPPLSGTILPGVMRDSVIRLLEANGTAVEERPITIDEVVDARASGMLSEIFGTGTAASVSPVGALGIGDNVITIGSGDVGPIAAGLLEQMTAIQYGKVQDEMGWTMEVAVALPTI